MNKAIVLLVDDASPGFWVQEGWPETWAIFDDQSIELLPCDGFRLNGAPGDYIRSKLIKKFGKSWRRYFRNVYVVTDSNFSGNPAGGSLLLEELRQSRDLAWELAVVYSEVPMLDYLTESNRRSVRAVHNEGPTAAEKVRLFFATGIFPSLEPLWHLLGDLKTLQMCSRVALSKLQRREAVRLPQVSEYGLPAAVETNPESPFAPALFRLNQRIRIFSYETTSHFLRPLREDFGRYLTMAAHLNLLPDEPSSELASKVWGRLCCSLHPIESLDQISPLRTLWELVQTGGDTGRIVEHPILAIMELSARERAWVKMRLAQIVNWENNPSSLGVLVSDALVEYEWLLGVSQAVEGAQVVEKAQVKGRN